MHTQHSWAGDRNCSYSYKYIMRANDTWAAASFRHTPRSGVSSLDASSSVSFSTLQVQTVNGVNITAEAQKQTDLSSKVDLLEARIFKLEKIINVLLNV